MASVPSSSLRVALALSVFSSSSSLSAPRLGSDRVPDSSSSLALASAIFSSRGASSPLIGTFASAASAAS